MDPDSALFKLMREEIRTLNLECDEDDRRTGLLAVKKAALKTEAEKRAKIQANVDKALAERHAAEKAAEASNEKAAVEIAAEASNEESPKKAAVKLNYRGLRWKRFLKKLQNKTLLRRLLVHPKEVKVETITDEGVVSQDTIEDGIMSDDYDAVVAQACSEEHKKAVSSFKELFAEEPIKHSSCSHSNSVKFI